MIVEVYHDGIHTASVDTPPEYQSHEDMLEYAWRWTNNIEGSWSRPGNPDYNPKVTVHAPLPVHDGKVYGHRSSMMGDLFKIGDRSYIVAMMGFREVGNSNG